MRLGEYFEIGKKMKAARTKAGISQREMAQRLSLTNSAYSNYENGYSEPSVETILKLCDIVGISFDDLLGLKIPAERATVGTFADLFYILIDLDRRGLPIEGTVTYVQKENQLIAHLNLEIANAQIATFIPDWHKINEKLKNKEISEEDYQYWLDGTLSLFNVPIDEYI